MKTPTLILGLGLIATSAASAVTIGFGASIANGLADNSGSALTTGFVELGSITGRDSSTFSLIAGGALDGFGAGVAGFGNPISAGNIAVAAGDQFAIRVYDSADNTGNVLLFASSPSFDGGSTNVPTGNGTSLDTAVGTIDVSFLLNGGAIAPDAVFFTEAPTVDGAGNIVSGFVVPEPSAALLGLIGLAGLLRRRR